MNVFNVIKERIPILDVISQHLTLKKIGGYWKGQCPFHSEKTASFTVSPHREIFYCFGCQAGGDVISFIAKIENCTPIEAAKQLADRYNIELPEMITSEITATIDEKKNYFMICKAVAQWAHKQLFKSPFALSYLEQRGLSPKSIEAFSIGYFPEGSKAVKELTRDLSEHNFLLKDLIHAGIINEGKTAYSPFEGRIIFPIKDHLGNFCGFGGRVLKNDDTRSKYYNSKEGSFFQKGHLLFGFDSAKKTMQLAGSVFLVEGYTDCIAMTQNGYTNTVATLGTACTPEHLKALSHHVHTVYLLYDGDTAGHKATLRVAQMCWQANLEVKVVFLPDGQDPASFFEHEKTLDPFIAQAQEILHYLLSSLSAGNETQPLTVRLQATRTFLEVIKKLEDPLKREILLQRAASAFNLPLSSLKQEILRSPVPVVAPAIKKVEPVNELEEISSLEKNFLYAILSKIELLERKQVLDLLDYLPEPFKMLIKKLKDEFQVQSIYSFDIFFSSLKEQEKAIINQIIFTQDEEVYDIEQIMLLLEKKYWKEIVNATKQKLTQAQAENDPTRVRTIVESFLELKKRLLHKGLI